MIKQFDLLDQNIDSKILKDKQQLSRSEKQLTEQ